MQLYENRSRQSGAFQFSKTATIKALYASNRKIDPVNFPGGILFDLVGISYIPFSLDKRPQDRYALPF